MGVGAEGAAEREAVGSGLLLGDGPFLGAAGLGGLEIVDQFGPLDAGADFDQAALLIEGDDAVHAAGVDQTPSLRNCWPPMAWRPPAMHRLKLRSFASRNTCCSPWAEAGRTLARRWVAFSWL